MPSLLGEESKITIVTAVGLKKEESPQDSFDEVFLVGPTDFGAATMRAFVSRHDDQPRIEHSLSAVTWLVAAWVQKRRKKSQSAQAKWYVASCSRKLPGAAFRRGKLLHYLGSPISQWALPQLGSAPTQARCPLTEPQGRGPLRVHCDPSPTSRPTRKEERNWQKQQCRSPCCETIPK
jgi:hypothetical protein